MATYYIDPTYGGANGSSLGTESRPYTAFSQAPALAAGDSVLFKRGTTHYGTITIGQSGTSGSRITLGAYGTGAKPVLSGFTTLSSWTLHSGNIYYASVSAQNPTYVRNVSINGTLYAKARYPKALNYLRVDTGVHTSTSWTSSGAIGIASYVGAEVAMRTSRWTLDVSEVTSHDTSTGALTVATAFPGGAALQNYGFFFQNHLNACTDENEWVWDATNKRVYVHFGTGTPTGKTVMASTVTNILILSNRSYITVQDLEVAGSVERGIVLGATTGITINNCDLRYNGLDGVSRDEDSSSPAADVDFIFTNNYGYGNTGRAFAAKKGPTNATFQYNNIQHTGMIEGHGKSGNNGYVAFSISGNNMLVSYNKFEYVGYNAIRFVGSDVTIENNFVRAITQTVDDGGAIYTFSGDQTNGDGYLRRIIRNNIVIGEPGNSHIATTSTTGACHGIYMDDNSRDVQLLNNVVFNCPGAGFYLHNAWNIEMKNNISGFNNSHAFRAIHNAPAGEYHRLENLDIQYNTWFAMSNSGNSRYTFRFRDDESDFSSPKLGIIDNNIISRPTGETGTHVQYWWMTNYTGTVEDGDISFPTWKSQFGYDANSKQSPSGLSTDASAATYLYNETTSKSHRTLTKWYKDLNGTMYSPTSGIVVDPYYGNIIVELADQVGIDQTAPTPGNSGALSFSSITGTSATVNWTAATDAVAHSSLLYSVYISESNNLSSIGTIKENGTLVGEATGITSMNLTGLVSGTTYWVGVIVRDATANESTYLTNNSFTATTTDTAPEPGNSGILTSSATSSSVTLNWTQATDDITAPGSLVYEIYQASSNTLTDVANTIDTGLKVTEVTGVNTVTLTELAAGTTFWWNILVRDTATTPNRAAYAQKQQNTSSASVLTIKGRKKKN